MKDSGIQSVEDLKGKKIAFGAVDSPQARLIPIYFLHENGLEYGKDYEEIRFDIGVGLNGDHVGGEEDAVKSTMKGETDAAFARDLNVETWIANDTIDGEQVKILAKTDNYDHCLFQSHKNVSDNVNQQFKEILMSLNKSDPLGKKVLETEEVEAFIEGRDDGHKLLEKANDYLEFLSSTPSK